ncbi:MAG: V-type ATP synthase subunit E [Clostridia bacterium]|nr:V-type ATP synthase subunit E [Clostridia bacterium]
MEIQLRELIEQIKKDGVQAAEAEAAVVLENAKAQAEKIVADAKAQAEKIVADAKSEADRMTKSGEDALRQAGRNVLISFRESVTRELTTIVGESVNTVYSSEALAELIANVVENMAGKTGDIEVVLNGEDLKKFEKTLLSALKEKMLTGVTLKANDNFDGGFRIAVDNGNVYYDYSAEAVVEMLSNYLSPRVAQLLKEA